MVYTISMKSQHKSVLKEITSIDQQTVYMYLFDLAEYLGLHGIDRQLTASALKTLVASGHLEFMLGETRVSISIK